MKLRNILIFALLIAASFCHAQDEQPANYDVGWFLTPNGMASVDTFSSGQTRNANPTYPGGTTAIAETITPDISALARNLKNDPTRIFNFVHDHIRYVNYFGSHKGAEMTLLERSGNDFDQCSLLVALLTAAGYSPIYEFGLVSIPYSAPNQQDYQHWVGATLPNTNWNNAIQLAVNINKSQGYPLTGQFPGDTNDVVFQHVWVQVPISGTNYSLDPAYKVYQPISGLNLDSAMQLNTNTLISSVSSGSTATADYVQGLNEGNLRSALASYSTNLLGYIQSNCANYNVQQIVSGQSVASSVGKPLGAATPFTIQTQGGASPVSQWNYIPTGLMAVLTVNLPGTNNSFYLPALAGSRLSIVCTSNGVAQLWQEDSMVSSVQLPGGSPTFTPTLGIQHPFGTNWSFSTPGFYPSRYAGNDQSVSSQTYQCSNATYVVMYGMDANAAWLTKRQRQLDAYRQQGYSDSSPQVTTETLNVMGLTWLTQTELAQQVIAGQTSTLNHYHHRLGRMAVETGRGYYVDVYEQLVNAVSINNVGTAALFPENQAFQVASYFGSAMEHGLIEQMQNTNLIGASTVKLIELASTNNAKIYLATSTNWSGGANVSGNISNYNTSGLYTNFISSNYFLLLPQSGSIQIAGSGSWAGAGYVAYLGSTNSPQQYEMMIGGGYHGGYVSDPDSTPSPPVISTIDDSAPTTFNPQSSTASVTTPLIADPVNPVNGAFQISSIDLSVGGVEPRGMNFSRSYSSARQNYNPAGMSPGWLHSYYCTALPTSAPLAGLGTTTPQQMASMIVGIRSALNIYNSSQPSPKSWVITALIAKWSLDQLIENAVSVSLGDSTIQFVRQPDGSFTPPANCTMSLTLQTNGTYWLSERHGRTFKFGRTGYLTNIVDLYGQSLTIAYNTNNWVASVTDWKNRSLVFNYSGTNLTSVTNTGTGRAVSFGYTANANGQNDLTSITDPTGATSSYLYDNNHQVIATYDALNRLLVTNVYGNSGQVVTQYTQGQTNQIWQVLCSGWNTLMIDPSNAVTEYVFDDKARQVGLYDALTNYTSTAYDGQDHVVMTVSPLLETNQFLYDNNHNLIASIDPLGHSNQFIFDTNFNLVRTIDKNGNPSYFGYNTNFQVIASTNGAGVWTTNSYDSTYGLLVTVTDSGGTISNSYDSNGFLSKVVYPSALGTNLYQNNALGDVLTFTNAGGGVTTFQYNLRRQLTNTVQTGISTNSIGYDPVGNAQTITDGRGAQTYNFWNPTRQLGWTAYPSTPQGVPYASYYYDNRGWLGVVVNPLNQPSYCNYDASHHASQLTDALYRGTTFRYDADGRQTNSTDPATHFISQSWTQTGLLSITTNQAGHTSSNLYDFNGNVTNLFNFNNQRWTFSYDRANHLTNTVSPLGKTCSQAYNNRGLLQSTTDANSQTTTFGYDARGRLTNRADNVAVTTYQYDFNNNRNAAIENGLSNAWRFDAFGRLTNYTDAAGHVIGYAYDANGNLTNLTYPGGRTVSYAYDSLNRLTNVTDWSTRKTTYTYDLGSELTSIVRPNGTVRSNLYDAAGELTNIIEQAASKAPIAFFKLSYDAASRVQWEFAAPLPVTNAMPSRFLQYDADDRLTNLNNSIPIRNDNNGNMTSGPLTNSTPATYSFDARNRLTAAGSLSYAYDPANYRTAITNGTNVTLLVVDPQSSQVLMRVKSGVTTYYVYGLGLLYEEDDTASTTNTLTYHYDSRGSTVALTDATGKVTDRFQYSGYGLLLLRQGTNDTPFQYNGKYGVQTDTSGLLYMRNRYYNPYICRFINADPSGFGGGVNMYAYANGDPISLADPFGLAAVGEYTGNTGTWKSAVSLPGTVPPPFFTIQMTDSSSFGQIDWSRPFSPPANNAPTATIGPSDPLSYLRNATMNTGSFTDPGSPLASVQANINISIYTTLLPVPGLGSGSTAAQEQYFISSGVRRSLQSLQNGLNDIPATIVRSGQADVQTTVRLDQLFSPKFEVPADSRLLSITPPIRVPIEVQPLGIPGQPASIPLNQVKIVPP